MLLRATQKVVDIAHYAIYAVFVLGIIMVSLSGGDVGFGEPWISASFVIWFALVGLAHGLVKPSVRALAARAEAIDPGVELRADSEATAAAKKLALGEGLTQLLLVAALVVMVWQFGG